jgi:60 kDa SS-A/Ro ribonucleoprotein
MRAFGPESVDYRWQIESPSAATCPNACLLGEGENAMKLTQHFSKRQTPQSQPIPGAGQVANSTGGFAWAVDDWTRLRRFLILGTEGGSYYASEATLTRENAQAVERCIAQDGLRTVREIVEISDAGRAPKNDPALFALAMCAGLGDTATRREALAALPRVARIGTHLFHFATYVEAFRGWGRGLRQAIGDWYNARPTRELALQMIKYGQRDGWSHRDLLRLAHPKTEDATRNTLYHWAVDGWESVGEEPHSDEALRQVWAFERLQKVETEQEAARLVTEYALPMEAVPTEKRGRQVWEAVLPNVGLTFLIRNLGNLSKVGILTKGANAEIADITRRITNPNALKKARIHPIQILAALVTYRQGHGARGKGEWSVVPQVADALDAAFYTAFGNVQAAGNRWILALDVSASMTCGSVAGVPGLTPRVASAAMSMVTYRTEQQVSLVGFSHEMQSIDIGRAQRLDDVVNIIERVPMGGTDCALPMLWAMQNRVEADTFVIYTDSETWYGKIHPAQALQQYRQRLGIPARLVVVGMLANKFSIADPTDAGMLDLIGFDTSAPDVIRQFAAGTL